MDGFLILMWIPIFFMGMMFGGNMSADSTRDKTVVYCIEKPQLCQEEYQNIKTQNKLNSYQKPEIK